MPLHVSAGSFCLQLHGSFCIYLFRIDVLFGIHLVFAVDVVPLRIIQTGVRLNRPLWFLMR